MPKRGLLSKRLKDIQGSVNSAAYSPDGKRIASGGSDNDKAIRIWNADDGALLNTLEGYIYWINSIAYSPDGKTIAGGGWDGAARIWDAESGALLRVLEGHQREIRSVAYSPDGKTIVIGSGDGTARVWNAESGALLHTLEPENRPSWVRTHSVAYSPDGRLIASGGLYEGGVGVLMWNAAGGSPFRKFEILANRHCVAFSPDGHNLASGGDSGIVTFNIKIGERIRWIRGHPTRIKYALFTPDGQGIAVVFSANILRIWEPETGALLRRFTWAFGSKGVFSPDGKLHAGAKHNRTIISVYDVDTDSELRTLKGYGIQPIAFSPDGKTLAYSNDEDAVYLRNVETGFLFNTLEGYTKEVLSAAFSPDGKTIVTGSNDFTVRIWDAKTGALFNTLKGHTKEVLSAAFSPDGKTIVSADKGETVRTWDADGSPLNTLEGRHWAAYSPDGKRIAGGGDNNAVRIWDAKTGALLKTLEGHTDMITWVGYSSDGKTLGSASDDGTVLLWDASD